MINVPKKEVLGFKFQIVMITHNFVYYSIYLKVTMSPKKLFFKR